jgi:hypothetical protein
MKKPYLLALSVVAALALAGAAYFNGMPLLPARQSTFTLLYTGDVGGHVRPTRD